MGNECMRFTSYPVEKQTNKPKTLPKNMNYVFGVKLRTVYRCDLPFVSPKVSKFRNPEYTLLHLHHKN